MSLQMDVFGWIVVGLLSGIISGWLLGGKTARGCLPNVIVGVLGGLIGGWLATAFGVTQVNGFVAALLVAIGGSLVIRLVLNTMRGED